MEEINGTPNEAPKNEDVNTTEQAPKTATPPVEQAVVDPVKERFGIDIDSLPTVIERANKYGWLEQDQFASNVLSKYREGKPFNEVVNVLGKDWSKETDENIIRESLARQGITETDLQDLKINQMLGGYEKDDESPEARLARKGLSAEAAKLKAKFIEEQQAFGQPVNHPEQQTKELEQQLSQWQQYVDNDKATKSMVETKRLALEFDGKNQNLEVDADALLDLIKKPGKLMEAIGSQDIQTQLQLAAFIKDPKNFIGQIAEIGKLSAKESVLSEERNPQTSPHVEPPSGPRITDKDPKDWTDEEAREVFSKATWKR